MLRESFNLGHILGIGIKLNWSVLVIFGLILVNLAVGVFPAWHPQWSWQLVWAVSLGASVVFFLSLLAHELAHSLTARRYGLEVRNITLFLFGGVSDIHDEPDTPWREVVIAGVGPLMSLLLGLGFLGLFSFIAPSASDDVGRPMKMLSALGPAASMLAWVGPINIALAIFNMIPALPLDGGRVFRAALWEVTGDLARATRWSVTVARLISWTLVGLGVAMMFGITLPVVGSGLVGGLWLAVIGWFLGRSAMASYTQLVLEEALEGIEVQRLIRPSPATVSSQWSLDQWVEHTVMEGDCEAYPVVDDGQYRGLVEFSSVHRVDQDDWSHTTIDQILRPAAETLTAGPRESVASVVRTMLRDGLDELPVVDGQTFCGLLSRSDVFRWVHIHSDHDMPAAGCNS